MRQALASVNKADLFFYLVAWSVAALMEFGALYCLFTGLNPFQRRRWYDRVWRVVVAVVGSLLVYLFLFGDS
jgi:hypothetical protein